MLPEKMEILPINLKKLILLKFVIVYTNLQSLSRIQIRIQRYRSWFASTTLVGNFFSYFRPRPAFTYFPELRIILWTTFSIECTLLSQTKVQPLTSWNWLYCSTSFFTMSNVPTRIGRCEYVNIFEFLSQKVKKLVL